MLLNYSPMSLICYLSISVNILPPAPSFINKANPLRSHDPVNFGYDHSNYICVFETETKLIGLRVLGGKQAQIGRELLE